MKGRDIHEQKMSRFLAMLLAATMTINTLPLAAMATDPVTPPASNSEEQVLPGDTDEEEFSHPEGTIENEDGTFTYPDGTIHDAEGNLIEEEFSHPEGTVENEDGTFTYPDGTIHDAEGNLIEEEEEPFVHPEDAVDNSDGTFTYADGSIHDEKGNIIPSESIVEPEVIAVSDITLDETSLEVGVGELPMTLTATVLPEDATDKTVTWTSSDPGVVSVDENGELTFGYMGEAVITATAGDFSAECVVTVGEGEWNTYESDSVLVIAGSDYQDGDSDDYMTNIMNQIDEDYDNPYGALLGGDYDAGKTTSSATLIQNVDDVIDSVFPNIASDKRIFLQGNHEGWSGVTPGSDNLLTTTGAHDTDYYGVYAINHDDFPWYYANPTESLVK